MGGLRTPEEIIHCEAYLCARTRTSLICKSSIGSLDRGSNLSQYFRRSRRRTSSDSEKGGAGDQGGLCLAGAGMERGGGGEVRPRHITPFRNHASPHYRALCIVYRSQ